MAYMYFPNRRSSGLHSVNAYGRGPVYIESKHINDSRRDQEEGGGAGLERESWTSFASVVSQRRSYGHCL